MVSLTLKQRLAELEAKAKTPSQQTEVLAILRSRIADPATSEHKRELMQLVLKQSRAMTFGQAKGLDFIGMNTGAMYGNP